MEKSQAVTELEKILLEKTNTLNKSLQTLVMDYHHFIVASNNLRKQVQEEEELANQLKLPINE